MASTILALVGVLAAGPLVWGPALSGMPVDAVLTKAVNDEARILAAARRLPLTRPVAVRALDRAHLAAEREALQRRARSPEEARGEDALWAALGLGAPRATRTSPADVTGLYDVVQRRLLLANWEPLEAGTFARSRDIAQALLDGRFELGRRLRDAASAPDGGVQSDVTLARQALWEGDATVQALERVSPDGTLPSSRALRTLVEGLRDTIASEAAGAAPLALARRLLVQLDGLTFVAAARARLPWSAVNQLWEHPPASTEQILHPEKYERGDAPDDVGARLPRQMSSAGRIAFADTLGELGVRAFLRRAVGDYRAERAAMGWGGDRALMFRQPGDGDEAASAEYVAWVTTWDGGTDAQDFAEQASAALAALAGAPVEEVVAPVRRPPRGISWAGSRRWRGLDAGGRLFSLEQRGVAVGLLVGAPVEAEALLPKLLGAAAARKSGRPRGRD
ncbi:MAG TPA: hypothetical protein VHU40_15390 [Polyangia bacterium]|nr:hypothetical protein [Polyangia bacterium]